MSARVLFYTQHLLGIGHLMRSLRITAAMVRAGLDVELVIGGTPVSGIGVDGARITLLPPLNAGPAGFSALVTVDGSAPDGAHMAERRRLLFDALERARPDALLIEAYPFARRMLRTELLPLIERARASNPRPLIISSVRDILQVNPRADRRREVVELTTRLFDAVLVHGDPAFARLDETFPETPEIADKIIYTGFVGPEPPSAMIDRKADVIISAGGGAVGFDLLMRALEAKPMTGLSDARWLAVTGPRMPDAERAAVTTLGGTVGAEVISFLPDLPAWLAQARLAIAQAGYNTVADLLAGRCRAVLVPFAEGGETEQTERATRLARARLAVHLPPEDISAARIALAIDAAARLPEIPPGAYDLTGAATTARLVGDLIHGRSA
jgi:predicted glycosyltransferase